MGRLLAQFDSAHSRPVWQLRPFVVPPLHHPKSRSSADNLTSANQTNLAIKGIIALEAMSKMSTIVKQSSDASKYSVRWSPLAYSVWLTLSAQNTASSLYGQWRSLAVDADQHVLAVYGQAGSWTLGYNLFADAWLGTNLVDSSVSLDPSSY